MNVNSENVDSSRSISLRWRATSAKSWCLLKEKILTYQDVHMIRRSNDDEHASMKSRYYQGRSDVISEKNYLELFAVILYAVKQIYKKRSISPRSEHISLALCSI